MSARPSLQLHWLGRAALADTLRATSAPHLPLAQLSDHYATADAALRDTVRTKISRLLAALAPRLQARYADGWPAQPADVLALDLAFVESVDAPFALAWVEIQAFTSMLPTFHTLHLAQCRAHGLPPAWLPHDPLPSGVDWTTQMRRWVAPDAASVLVEDRPHERASWPDFAAARHWWGVDIRDWRALRVVRGQLVDRADGRAYRHAWNRLILPDLAMPDRRRAESLLQAANAMSWHSHPAWYSRLDKGALADVPLDPYETCRWVESCPQALRDPDQWVAKAAGGHSGSGLLLTPTAAQLAALPRPRQWLVQRRFRQVPLGRHAATGTPLYGELRCMLGLKPGEPPWLMAAILRLSTNGIATLSGRATLPGEGMSLLYFEPEATTTHRVSTGKSASRSGNTCGSGERRA